MGAAWAAISGMVFGWGLIASGMTDPAKVKGFLDIAGAWDPSLALVMGGAIAVGLVAFAWAKRRTRAWNGDPFELPRTRGVDRQLVMGGLMFGVGWGLAGICPGPALVMLAGGQATESAVVFVVAMLVGMTLHDRVWARRPR